MTQCPDCKRTLSSAEASRLTCPHCGASLTGNADALRGGAGETIQLAPEQPTVDGTEAESMLERAATNERPPDQTVVLADEPDRDPAGAADTAATVDLPLPGLGDSKFDLQGADQTIDSQVIRPASSKTDPKYVDQTMDVEVTPSSSGSASGNQQTLDTPLPSDSPSGTGRNIHEASTRGSSLVSEEDGWIVRRWGTAVNASEPGMTIRSEVGKVPPSDSTLVIQERHVGQGAQELGEYLDYDLRKTLGEGGMGIVYSARQASLDRNVAVKMLRPALNNNSGLRKKFFTEAVLTGELEHPGIIPIYDLGLTRDGSLFYSMKQVDGQPWSKVIRQKSLTENLEILMRVCDAVAFSHSRDVIHRDLKPENIILGGFGEVLVLDWGMAAYVGPDPKLRSMAEMTSMGGTPAYMAPEMATGPLSTIGKHSDVYLLGAILYECITGKLPRQHSNTTKCLIAATRNELDPTDKQGELVDIALKAMASRPEDRYPSVQALQTAIREYQSHTESVLLASRAAEDLQHAESSGDYRDFSKAVFGFEEALQLWDANETARQGLDTARQAYARQALRKSDFELGLSLLDADRDEHAELYRELSDAQNERDARQRRLALARRVTVALVVLVILSISLGSLLVWQQRNIAMHERDVATEARSEAELARDRERDAAEQARQSAEEAQRSAAKEKLAREAEQTAREDAETRKLEAERQRNRAEYEAYVALVGLAAAKIDEQSFDQAYQLLQLCRPDLRNWEWGRLMYVCTLRDRFAARTSADRVEAVACDRSGELVAALGVDGTVQVWQKSETTSRRMQWGNRGWCVAVSPANSQWLALGGGGRTGQLQLWNWETGEQRQLEGHTDDVLCVRFSPDGSRLLSGSKDRTARLWDVQSGQSLQVYQGHSWWVWDVDFLTARLESSEGLPTDGGNGTLASTSDEAAVGPGPTRPQDARLHSARSSVVTASQDGTVIVWDLETGTQPVDPTTQEPMPFREHEGPVFALATSPTGDLIATAGSDRRVLLWRKGDLQPFDFQQFVSGGKSRTTPVLAELIGHTGAIRDLAFSDDGRLLASASSDNTIKIWAAVDQTWDGTSIGRGTLLRTLRGHSSQVRSVIFLPSNSDQVFSGGYDRQVRHWGIRDFQEQTILHSDEVLAADFAASGPLVLTASRDRTARITDSARGGAAVEFREGHQFLVSGGAFFPEGGRLLTAAGDGSVRVWSQLNGSQLAVFERTGPTATATVSPDGRWIIAASEAGASTDDATAGESGSAPSVVLYDASSLSPKPVRVLRGHDALVTSLAVSTDSRWLFTGDMNGRGLVWSLDREELDAPRYRLRYHTARITDAQFLADGQLLTASSDRTVCTWRFPSDAGMDQPAADYDREQLLAHAAGVNSMAATPDGRYVLTGDAQGLHLWDREKVREIWSAATDRSVTSVAIDSGGKWALCVDHARTGLESAVRLWQWEELPDEVPPLFMENDQQLWSAEFSPDSESILVLGNDGATLWTSEGSLVRVFSPHRTVAFAGFSSAMDKIVTAGWDNTVRIWDSRTSQSLRTIVVNHQLDADDPRARVNAAVFSQDDRWIVTAGEDGVVRLFDAENGEPLQEYLGHESGVTFAKFMNQGQWILSASRDRTARIWDRATGELVRVLQENGHTLAVLHADGSPDGRFVVTSGEDMQALVWDVESARVLATLRGHTGPVNCASFSPRDGTRLLTGSEDGKAKIWDVHDLWSPGPAADSPISDASPAASATAIEAKELLTLHGHRGGITTTAFSQDGLRALTSSRDGTAIVWTTTGWQ